MSGRLILTRETFEFVPQRLEHSPGGHVWVCDREALAWISLAPAGSVPGNRRRLLRVRLVTGSEHFFSFNGVAKGLATLREVLGDGLVGQDDREVPIVRGRNPQRSGTFIACAVVSLLFIGGFAWRHNVIFLIVGIVFGALCLALVAKTMSARLDRRTQR